MDGGIFKNHKLIRTLTSKDFKTYTSFNSLLEGNDIKDSGLSVICPTINGPDYGEDFFGSCMELQEIDMSSSSILFTCSSCINLETVFLPDNLSEYDIHKQFLGAASLKNFYIDKTNKNFATVDGVLYNKRKTALIHYPTASKADLDENLKEIKEFAFCDCNISFIKVPYGVTTLNSKSLVFNEDLKNVTILLPDTIEYISNAFIDDLTDITFYCSQSVKEKIEDLYIGHKLKHVKFELITLDLLLNNEPELSMTEINNYLKDEER